MTVFLILITVVTMTPVLMTLMITLANALLHTLVLAAVKMSTAVIQPCAMRMQLA